MDANKPEPSINISEEELSSWDIIAEQRKYNLKIQQEIKQAQGLMSKEGMGDADPQA